MKRFLLLGIVVALLAATALLYGVTNRGKAPSSKGSAPQEPLAGAVAHQTRSRQPTLAEESILSRDSGDGEFPDVDSACFDVCGTECKLEHGSALCPPACRSQQDCSGSTVCALSKLNSVNSQELRCLASNCEQDHDCAPSEHCKLTNPEGNVIRRCADRGQRLKSESCAATDGNALSSCTSGLHCVGGRCLPSHCDVAADCPDGSICTGFAGTEQQGCFAWCASSEDCPATHICTSVGGANRCVPSAAAGCLVDGCQDGDTCYVDSNTDWDFKTSCGRACEASVADACPEEETCRKVAIYGSGTEDYRCFEDCATSDYQCAPGYQCLVGTSGVGYCKYDSEAAALLEFTK